MRISDEDIRLANNLEMAKRARGLTNLELGRALKGHTTSDDNVRNWVQERLSGKRPLTWGQLVRLAQVLDIPVRVLTGQQEHIFRHLSQHPELLSDHVGRQLRIA